MATGSRLRSLPHGIPPLQLDLGVAAPPSYGSIEDAPLIAVNDIRQCSGHQVVVDTETTGLHWWKDRVIGVAVYCPAIDLAGYIPCEPDTTRAIVDIMLNEWSPDTFVINHNIKFDFHMLGIDPTKTPWDFMDTILMAHIVDSRGVPKRDGSWDNPHEERGSLSLARLAEYHLRDSAKSDHQNDPATRRGNKKLPHHQWPLPLLARYAVDDCRLTYEIFKVFGPILRQRNQIDVLRTAMRYLGILWRAERHGLPLDLEHVSTMQSHIGVYLNQLSTQLQDIIGEKFDWTSHQQLSWALYDKYGHRKPALADSRKGLDVTSTATSTDVLLKLAKHPLAPLVVQMRGLDKMRQFISKWLELMDRDSRIHTTFNQTNARTARLSSSDPNLQQLPGDERSAAALDAFDNIEALQEFYAGLNMRKSFVAPSGLTYLAGDYKQQEVRMFAILAKDEAMLAACQSGGDLHAEMAYEIWKEYVNPYRDWAKTVSLGLMYGRGIENLSGQLGDGADRIISDYHARFRGVRRMQRQTRDQMERSGYVTYWSGRRYYRNDSAGYYKAVNALVQGGSADLLMYATVDLHDWIEANNLPVNIVNFVHDEVDFEVDATALAELAPQIAERMQMPHLLGIPFLTDMKAGTSLGELEKLTLP